MDIQSLSKYKDKYTHLLSVMDVFSKFPHIVPLRSQTSTAGASAFRSILPKYSHTRPIWVRTDRGKEFLNRSFQDMLKEGIQIQVCRDPNVKYAIVERSHRKIRDKLYKLYKHLQIHICTAEIRHGVQRYGSECDWHGNLKSEILIYSQYEIR
jgi:transposase InsO family protein